MLPSQEHELLYGQVFAAFGVCSTVYSCFSGDGSIALTISTFLTWGLSCLCFYVMCCRYQQREYELSQENWRLRQQIKTPPNGGD